MAKGHARNRGNNRWQLEVDLGKKVGGKGRNRKYKTITAETQKEANIELAKFIADVTGKGYVENKKIGFADFVNEHWMPKCATKRLANTTLQTHIQYLELRILPAFQYFRLDEIEPIHVIDFLNNLGEEGMRLDGKEGKLSDSSIAYHRRILNNVFNFAVEIKFLKESPLKGIQKPSVEYKEVDPYTFEEASEVIAALEEESLHWNIAINLLFITGMRRSEIYGLDLLKHIDLERNVVKVRSALTYTKLSGYQINEIKKGTRRSKRRDIPIPEDLAYKIRVLIHQRKQERFAVMKEDLWREGKHFLLLSHENGEPYHPSSIKNWWIRFLKRHNLRYITIHALRHTMVNLLIELNIPLSQISRRAGHSGISITNDTYGHKINSVDELATEALNNALRNGSASSDEVN